MTHFGIKNLSLLCVCGGGGGFGLHCTLSFSSIVNQCDSLVPAPQVKIPILPLVEKYNLTRSLACWV